MPSPPSPLLCREKKRASSPNTRGRRGSATRKRLRQPIAPKRAGSGIVTSLAALTCPLPEPEAQPAAPPTQDGGSGTEGTGRGRGNRRGLARAQCWTGALRILALQISRENSVLTLEPAAALTFCHGAEGGDGRRWRCEDSAQASPPLSSLGGEWGTGHRTAAALAGVLAPHWSRDRDSRSLSRMEFDWLRVSRGAGKSAVRRGSLATSAVSDGIGQSWPWSGSARGLYLVAGAVGGPRRLGVTSSVSLWEPS